MLRLAFRERASWGSMLRLAGVVKGKVVVVREALARLIDTATCISSVRWPEGMRCNDLGRIAGPGTNDENRWPRHKRRESLAGLSGGRGPLPAPSPHTTVHAVRQPAVREERARR